MKYFLVVYGKVYTVLSFSFHKNLCVKQLLIALRWWESLNRCVIVTDDVMSNSMCIRIYGISAMLTKGRKRKWTIVINLLVYDILYSLANFLKSAFAQALWEFFRKRGRLEKYWYNKIGALTLLSQFHCLLVLYSKVLCQSCLP